MCKQISSNSFKNEITNKLISYIICTSNIGGACGVMVIIVGNGHGDTSSNPGWDWLHFT